MVPIRKVNGAIRRSKAKDRKELRASLFELMSKEWKNPKTKSAYMLSFKQAFDKLPRERQISLIREMTTLKPTINPIFPDDVTVRRKRVLKMLQKALADEK